MQGNIDVRLARLRMFAQAPPTEPLAAEEIEHDLTDVVRGLSQIIGAEPASLFLTRRQVRLENAADDVLAGLTDPATCRRRVRHFVALAAATRNVVRIYR